MKCTLSKCLSHAVSKCIVITRVNNLRKSSITRILHIITYKTTRLKDIKTDIIWHFSGISSSANFCRQPFLSHTLDAFMLCCRLGDKTGSSGICNNSGGPNLIWRNFTKLNGKTEEKFHLIKRKWKKRARWRNFMLPPVTIRVFNGPEFSGRHEFQAKKIGRQCTKSGSHAKT